MSLTFEQFLHVDSQEMIEETIKLLCQSYQQIRDPVVKSFFATHYLKPCVDILANEWDAESLEEIVLTALKRNLGARSVPTSFKNAVQAVTRN